MRCFLIQTPSIDFTTFLTAGNQMTGKSLSAVGDAQGLSSDTQRFLSCLEQLAPQGNILSQVSFSMLVVADGRDLRDVVEHCQMPFVSCETVSRSLDAAVIHGTLEEWRRAVISGLSQSTPLNVRGIFSEVMLVFERADLGSVWANCKRKPAQMGYYLEHQP